MLENRYSIIIKSHLGVTYTDAYHLVSRCYCIALKQCAIASGYVFVYAMISTVFLSYRPIVATLALTVARILFVFYLYFDCLALCPSFASSPCYYNGSPGSFLPPFSAFFLFCRPFFVLPLTILPSLGGLKASRTPSFILNALFLSLSRRSHIGSCMCVCVDIRLRSTSRHFHVCLDTFLCWKRAVFFCPYMRSCLCPCYTSQGF